MFFLHLMYGIFLPAVYIFKKNYLLQAQNNKLQYKNLLMQLSNIFIHHVYFWLKNEDSKEDLDALIKGLQTLSSVQTIQQFHIGRPAATSREVIDGSYAASWMLVFKSKEDQDNYQVDPIHLNFVKECAHLWHKVVVYDSKDA